MLIYDTTFDSTQSNICDNVKENKDKIVWSHKRTEVTRPKVELTNNPRDMCC